MKICPNCHEENSNFMDKCYKCNAQLPASKGKKICTQCGEITETSGRTCPVCSGTLADYSSNAPDGYYTQSDYSYSSRHYSDVETWEYVLAVLIPLIGLILGFIHIGKDDKDGGKKLIIISLAVCVICGIIYGVYLALI